MFLGEGGGCAGWPKFIGAKGGSNAKVQNFAETAPDSISGLGAVGAEVCTDVLNLVAVFVCFMFGPHGICCRLGLGGEVRSRLDVQHCAVPPGLPWETHGETFPGIVSPSFLGWA